MNTNPLVLAALSGINIPKQPLGYTGTGEDYITFNDSDNRPLRYAEDIDTMETALVDIHFFTKGNPKATSKAIRKALRNAGFIYLSTVELYEEDTKYNHTIIEARITAASETQEDDY